MSRYEKITLEVSYTVDVFVDKDTILNKKDRSKVLSEIREQLRTEGSSNLSTDGYSYSEKRKNFRMKERIKSGVK